MASMATLTGSAKNTQVLNFKAAGIHNFRFIGLEIDCADAACASPNDITQGLVEMDGGFPNTVTATPNEIILDRCYIHGSPTQNIRSGVRANGTNIAIIDSTISEIHEAVAASAGDSQAIEDWNGAGPLLIQNDYLEAASENVMLGGAATSVPGLIPSDVTITGNTFYKDLAWRNAKAPFNWLVKNHLEFKNAQRVLVTGNTFENSWYAAQAGEFIDITPRALEGDGHETVADVAITGNFIQHGDIGITVASSDNNHTPTSQPPQRILIQDNLLLDMNVAWGGNAWCFLLEDTPAVSALLNWHDLTIDHNSCFVTGKFADGFFLSGGTGPSALPAGPVAITNNTVNFAPGFAGNCTVNGSGKACGNVAISFYLKNPVWQNNAIPDALTLYPAGSVAASGAAGTREAWWQ